MVCRTIERGGWTHALLVELVVSDPSSVRGDEVLARLPGEHIHLDGRKQRVDRLGVVSVQDSSSL